MREEALDVFPVHGVGGLDQSERTPGADDDRQEELDHRDAGVAAGRVEAERGSVAGPRLLGDTAEAIETTMFDDEQTRLDIFQNKTEARNSSRCSPNFQLIAVVPDAEMDLRTLDGGREFGEHAGVQGQRVLEDHRLSGLFRRQKRKRDLGNVSLLAAETCPEGYVDERLDMLNVGRRGANLREFFEKMGVNSSRDVAGGRVWAL